MLAAAAEALVGSGPKSMLFTANECTSPVSAEGMLALLRRL